jgi:hypothetical protein
VCELLKSPPRDSTRPAGSNAKNTKQTKLRCRRAGQQAGKRGGSC